MTPARLALRAAASSAACALLGACALLPPDRTGAETAQVHPLSVELAAVPFFAQQDHQCGPAALATLLVRAGVDVSPETLADEVYLPGREGTLSAELVAGVRRHGRLPEVLPQRLDAVLDSVAAGHPVLVLQNLGLGWLPRWHYATVIGYDLALGEVWLRSGAEARQALPLYTFDLTWSRSGRFALIALRPGEAPVAAGPAAWLKELAVAHAPMVAWETATRRWPEAAAAWFGLGNARMQGSAPDVRGAELAWRETLRLDPAYVPAYNNLALLRARQGSAVEAQALIDSGLSRTSDPALRAQLSDTRQEIAGGKAAAAGPTAGAAARAP